MTGGDTRNEQSGLVLGPSIQAGRIDVLNVGGAAVPPGPVRPPAQLPADGPWFTDRVDEQDLLNAVLDRRERSDRAPVAVVSGFGGVGKSALGVHWAHGARGRFPDGQLYVDLSGLRHRGAVEVGDVVGGFLRVLGVPEEAIPADRGGRAALFRSMLADKAALIFVDDAHFAAEVVPLIPASARCMVVVTSHSRLGGLVMEGATQIALSPLEARWGGELLASMLGKDRVAAEPDAVADLVGLCGGLPIALRVAGSRLLSHPVWRVATLVERLAGDLLAGLLLDGRPVVTAVFNDAYQGLPAAAQVLYRRLGLCPGPDFTAAAAAAAAGLPEHEVHGPLEILYEASLLQENVPDRYRFHDLIGGHAHGLGTAEEDVPALVRRVVEYYLRMAVAADEWVMGSRLRLNAGDVDRTLFDSPAKALDWVETERSNLLAAVRAAAGSCPELVPPLAQALWALYQSHSHHSDQIEAYELAVRSTGPSHDPGTEAQMRVLLARGLMEAGEFARAEPELAAARLATSGNRRLEALVAETTGLLNGRRGDTDGAIEAFGLARAVNEEVGNPRGVGLQSYHIGRALHEAGRDEEAVRELTGARRIAAELGRPVDGAKAEAMLGAVYLALGRTAEAAAVLTSAVKVLRERHMALREAEALERLAEAVPEADGHLGRALAIYEAAHDPRADRVRHRLGGHSS